MLSGFLWLSSALNDDYDREVVIPVSIENVPKDVVLSDEVDTIRVMVHDKGFAFLQYDYGTKISNIVIDFESHNHAKGKMTVSSSELLKLVKMQLYSSSSITSIKPEKIECTYDYGVSKTVPVRIIGIIKPADEYYQEYEQVIPEKVTIYASKSIINDIKYVETEELNIVNYTDSVTVEAKLRSISGVKMFQKTVKIRLYADILTEETVEVPITPVNVPEGMILRLFPAKIGINYNVGMSMYNSIDKSQFCVEADYNKINTETGKVPIKIVQKPQGITKASAEATDIDYLIDK